LAIKFHYHKAARDIPPLGIRRGDRLCHVYSDTSVDELVTWGEARGWRRAYLDLRNDLPHFDAFRNRLRFCGQAVSRQEFIRDVRRWRTRRPVRPKDPERVPRGQRVLPVSERTGEQMTWPSCREPYGSWEEWRSR